MKRDHAGRFVRADGMANVLTGLGDVFRDKATGTRLLANADLTQHQIDALYHDDGLAAKIVDMPANDLTREGFEIRDFDGDLQVVESELETLAALEHLSDLDRWGSAYGGALLGAALDDGLPAYEPLDRGRIQRVRGLFVLDRHCVTPVWSRGRNVGEPDGYMIVTDGPEAEAIQGRLIHASRVQKFCGGTPLSRLQRQLRMGWGVSVYKRVWERLRRILVAYGYGETILQDISVDVFTIAGLAEAMQRGQEEYVRKRLMAMQLGKDVLHGVALDAGTKERPAEGYVTQSRSVTGVRELIEMFVNGLVSAVPIPRSELLGETSGGLNTGTNSGEKRTYNAFIKGRQTRYGTRWLNWILELMFASKDGPTRGAVPPKWTIHWHSLMTPTEAEVAELEYKIAQTDEIRWRTGAASSDDIRYTRIELGSRGGIEERPEGEDPPDMPDEDAAIEAASAAAGSSAPDVAASDPAAVAAAGSDVQASALNGAQMKEIRELARQIVLKQLPIEFGIEMLLIAAPGVVRSPADARRILESLRNFVPAAPVAVPQPDAPTTEGA